MAANNELELNNVIKEILVQITEGIKSANNTMPKGAKVTPYLDKNFISTNTVYRTINGSFPIAIDVNFNIKFIAKKSYNVDSPLQLIVLPEDSVACDYKKNDSLTNFIQEIKFTLPLTLPILDLNN